MKETRTQSLMKYQSHYRQSKNLQLSQGAVGIK